MKINYRKYWSKEGNVYDQTITISNKQYNKLKDCIDSEIALNYPRRKEYSFDHAYNTFLKPFIKENGIVWMTLTQTKFINLFLKLTLLDRNTRLKIKD